MKILLVQGSVTCSLVFRANVTTINGLLWSVAVRRFPMVHKAMVVTTKDHRRHRSRHRVVINNVVTMKVSHFRVSIFGRHNTSVFLRASDFIRARGNQYSVTSLDSVICWKSPWLWVFPIPKLARSGVQNLKGNERRKHNGIGIDRNRILNDDCEAWWLWWVESVTHGVSHFLRKPGIANLKIC